MNYIAIDRDRMLILWKHPSYKVLANLAWIECQNSTVCIMPINIAMLESFTYMEKMMLFKNTFQQDYVPNHITIASHIYELCNSRQIIDAVGWEVESQAGYVGECSASCYKYIKGASRPQRLAELFSIEGWLSGVDNTISNTPIVKNQPIVARKLAPNAGLLSTGTSTAPSNETAPVSAKPSPTRANKDGSPVIVTQWG